MIMLFMFLIPTAVMIFGSAMVIISVNRPLSDEEKENG